MGDFYFLAVSLGLGLIVFTLVVPLVALAQARTARGAMGQLELRVRALSEMVQELRKAAQTPDLAPTLPQAPAEKRAAVVLPAPAAEPPLTPSPPAVQVVASTPASPLRSIQVETPLASAVRDVASNAAAEGNVVAPQVQDGGSLEEKIALVWFTRIGAVALLLGISYFFKYAVDNNWIGPLGRVCLGAAAGFAILVFAELNVSKTRAVYSQILLGVGLASLYLSAYASFAFYHMFSAPIAFAAIVIITLLSGALAIRHRAQAILILGLIAGFAAPVLLSTGEDRAASLFGYLFVLTTLSFWVCVRMGFMGAAMLAVSGTGVLFAGWYVKFFNIHPPPRVS